MATNVDPSDYAIQELGLPTYSDLHARVRELEAALLKIAAEVKHAHDGAHIITVREICANALSR